jgi:hypothetical protein
MMELEKVDIFSTPISDNRERPTNMHPEYWLRKVKRPDYETLCMDIKMLGYVGTGKKYGVSDNAIRKWKNHFERQFENKKSHTQSPTQKKKGISTISLTP